MYDDYDEPDYEERFESDYEYIEQMYNKDVDEMWFVISEIIDTLDE